MTEVVQREELGVVVPVEACYPLLEIMSSFPRAILAFLKA